MTLSVIIVNFNTKDLLKRCLNSVLRSVEQSTLDLDLIVVDNGSTDSSQEYLKKLQADKHPKLQVILNKENIGFSQANNQAFRQARGEYLLFFNPDTLVLENALALMVDWLKKHPDFGVLGPQVLNEKKEILSSGGFFPNLGRIFLWASGLDHFPIVSKMVGSYHSLASFFEKERRLDWIQGCAFMVKREVFRKVGGFETKIFMYGEEVELCFKVKKEGWQVGFFPQAKIIHFGSKKSERPIIGEMKGLLLFYQKHFPSWNLPILKFLLKLAALLRMTAFGIITKDESLKKTYFKAWQAI